MRMEDMILISTDDHVLEPPDLFTKRVPAKFRDDAPKVVRFASGGERWTFEGRLMVSVTPSAVSGRKKEELGLEPDRYADVRKGTYDVHARIDDMNANGVLASLNFANVAGFGGEKLLAGKDKDLMLALITAYNDWHCDDWAGAYPGRFIPLALLPLWNVDLSIAEIERLAGKGVTVISFPENPANFGLPSIHDEHWGPIFDAIVDHGMAVAIHIGTSGAPLATPSPQSPAAVSIALVNIRVSEVITDLIFSPLLLKRPSLRFVILEGCMGWVPFLRERADAAHRNHGYWTGQDLGGLMPSDLIDRHFLFCFHEDNFGLKHRHEIGIGNIALEVDYPHADSTWPRTPEELWKSVQDFPDHEINLITHLNAMKTLNFDPFRHVPKAKATVGALRAQATHVDVSLKSMGGTAPIRTGKAITARDMADAIQRADQALGEPVAVLSIP